MTLAVVGGQPIGALPPPTVGIAQGGTGQTNAASALEALGGLNVGTHAGIDHTLLGLLSTLAHGALDHSAIPGVGRVELIAAGPAPLLIPANTLDTNGQSLVILAAANLPAVTNVIFALNSGGGSPQHSYLTSGAGPAMGLAWLTRTAVGMSEGSIGLIYNDGGSPAGASTQSGAGPDWNSPISVSLNGATHMLAVKIR